jgi:putative two-component system response regulator
MVAANAYGWARILVVDDEPSNARLLTRILERAGYRDVRTTSDARTVVPLFRERRPDVVLMDLHMPHVDGFGLLDALRCEVDHGEIVPVLVITADPSRAARERAHRLGARDYVMKPFDACDIVLRTERLLELRTMYRLLRSRNADLLAELRSSEEGLERAELEMLQRLTETAQYHDGGCDGHTMRVAAMSARLAAELGLEAGDVERVRRAAPLHDLGKVGLRDAILMKAGPLDRREFAAAERHTLIGATILSGSRFPLLRLAEEIALTHHERWDGTGYPRGLKGEDIPLAGRIVAVADVFDALTHARPYKQAWTPETALDEIRSLSGRHFDPAVVGALLRVLGSADAPPRPARRWSLEVPARPAADPAHGAASAAWGGLLHGTGVMAEGPPSTTGRRAPWDPVHA